MKFDALKWHSFVVNFLEHLALTHVTRYLPDKQDHRIESVASDDTTLYRAVKKGGRSGRLF
jgi:hypothetical protein